MSEGPAEKLLTCANCDAHMAFEVDGVLQDGDDVDCYNCGAAYVIRIVLIEKEDDDAAVPA